MIVGGIVAAALAGWGILTWWKKSHVVYDPSKDKPGTKNSKRQPRTDELAHQYAVTLKEISAVKENGNIITGIPSGAIIGIVTGYEGSSLQITLTTKNYKGNVMPVIQVGINDVKIISNTLGYPYWMAGSAFDSGGSSGSVMSAQGGSNGNQNHG